MSFIRPMGAAIDTKELEYVTALMQTCPTGELRSNGTISTRDIQIFLKSRFGFLVNQHHAIRVVRGLGGGILSDTVIQSILQTEIARQHQVESMGIHHAVEDLQEQYNPTMTTTTTTTAQERWKKVRLATQLNNTTLAQKRDGQQQEVESTELHLAAQDIATTTATTTTTIPPAVETAVVQQQQQERPTSASQQPYSYTNNKTTIQANNKSMQQASSKTTTTTTNNNNDDDVEEQEEDPMEFLDIVQLTATLLIPTLAHAGDDWRKRQEDDFPSSSDDDDKEEALAAAAVGKATPAQQQQQTSIHQMIMDELAADARARKKDLKPAMIFEEVLHILLNELEMIPPSSIQTRRDDDDPLNGTTTKRNVVVVVTPELVQCLLLAHGEKERAADPILISKMVQAAGGKGVEFNTRTLVNALTNDLHCWNIGAEDQPTTILFDVFGYSNFGNEQQLVESETALAASEIFDHPHNNNKNDDDDDDVEDPKAKTRHYYHYYRNSMVRPRGNDHADNNRGGGIGVDDDDDDDDNETMANHHHHRHRMSNHRRLSIIHHAADASPDKNWKLQRTGSAANTCLDLTVDKHSSLVSLVFIWCFFIATSTLYMSLIQPEGASIQQCSPSFNCTLGGTIWSWVLYAVILTTMGFLVIIPLSLGNNPTERTVPRTLFAFFMAIFFTLMPYFVLNWHQRHVSVNDPTASVVMSPLWNLSQNACLFCGVMLMILMLVQVTEACIGNRSIRHSFLLRYFLSHSSVFGSTNQKRSATRKINSMLASSLALHPTRALRPPSVLLNTPIKDNKKEQQQQQEEDEEFFAVPCSYETLLNFVLRGQQDVRQGGFVWTWKRFFNNELFEREGIWISSRMVIVQTAQVIIISVSIIAMMIGIEFTANAADNARAELDRFSNVSGIINDAADRLNGSINDGGIPIVGDITDGIDIIGDLTDGLGVVNDIGDDLGGVSDTINNLTDTVDDLESIVAATDNFGQQIGNVADQVASTSNPAVPQWVYDFVPTGAQTRAALYPAMAVSVATMMMLFCIYLPSYTTSMLKFRSGVFPSLKSTRFEKYRSNVSTVYMCVGNAIFAMIGSGVLFFALIGGAIFLFIWPWTRPFMLLLVAWGVGLVITVTLKTLLARSCRTKYYAGFYRTKPAAANLSTLALESWHTGLAGGVLVSRMAQFILAAAFWVGRIDVPFLNENVSFLGYNPDNVPTHFAKEILIHEAHRHPYIERIATMIMMKLVNNDFCSDGGACWRQLFVVALMPWLQKHRVFWDHRLKDMADEYNARRLLKEQKQKSTTPVSVMQNVTEEVVETFKDIRDEVLNIDERPDQFRSTRNVVVAQRTMGPQADIEVIAPQRQPHRPLMKTSTSVTRRIDREREAKVMKEMKETLRSQGQFQIILVTVVALLLLIGWIIATIWLVVLSTSGQCIVSGGTRDEFCTTSGAVDVHNVVFGIVSAVVLLESAMSRKGRHPSNRFVSRVYRTFPRDTWIRRVIVWTPAVLFVAWFAIGLLSLVIGVIASDNGGAVRMTGFAWLGFLAATLYFYCEKQIDEPVEVPDDLLMGTEPGKYDTSKTSPANSPASVFRGSRAVFNSDEEHDNNSEGSYQLGDMISHHGTRPTMTTASMTTNSSRQPISLEAMAQRWSRARGPAAPDDPLPPPSDIRRMSSSSTFDWSS